MYLRNKNKTDFKKEIQLTILSLSITGIACVLLGKDLFWILIERLAHGDISMGLVQLGFISIITFLLFGNFVYHFARLGQLRRRRIHKPSTPDSLESLYEKQAPSLAVLIPSYKEDPKVITKTLLSAALLDYPLKQIVLLIDNPPTPDNDRDRVLLSKTRNLPQEIHSLLEEPATRFRNALNGFIYRRTNQAINAQAELTQLAQLYTEAAMWLEKLGSDYPINNHEDQWFVEQILLEPAQKHREKAFELVCRAGNKMAYIGERCLFREYNRLSRLFQVQISSFERKRFVNLSHEPNKAMNLNSYIGLMGSSFAEEHHVDGISLVSGDGADKAIYIPDTDFLITLDADSLLQSDYALRLVELMQQDGNERLAVAQTPYSAFPGAPGLLERMAGATTDIQYLIHQGFTQYNATFWVGANALLRKAALEDIVTTETERGFEIHKYIQDRTVIEDTESSVDLLNRGWRLYNYPERLAFSATPPDFGSLLIQRRRWANGGLVILPKFLQYITKRGTVPCRGLHGLLGGHYLTSLAGVNLGFLLLLLWPFEEAMRTLWLPVATIPYFLLYARDLMQTGYRPGDVLRVYALNLLLVPVNLGGVFKSIQQIITGKRTPFSRTPKVKDRTATPLLYLLAVYGCMGYCLFIFNLDMQAGRWLHAIFAAVNGSVLLYALLGFIGIRETLEDIALALGINGNVEAGSYSEMDAQSGSEEEHSIMISKSGSQSA